MPVRTLLAVLLIACVQVAAPAAEPDADVFFENQVRPLLVKACQECHGPVKQWGELRLDSRGAMLRGGETGPVLVPGQPTKSLLIEAISHGGDVRMPPKKKLDAEQIAVLTRWVELGAPWPGDSGAILRKGEITAEDRAFWSFQPIKKPAVPTVRDQAWPITDVDRFLHSKWEAKGLLPAGPAEKQTLLRRATFDLIGLPPTPDEIEAFLSDDTPEAFPRVVDRLLASPHYGERWGRHWLDVVRYGDTAGETADYPVPQAYRYRNYVIQAFNADKPYDQFVREQLAGDLLALRGPREKYAEQVTATGFLAISRRFGFDPENYHHLTIQDSIDTIGQAFLGLTLGCARCHDHKFDPVTRQDYYALYGIFDSSKYTFPGSEEKKRPYDLVPLLPPAEVAESQAKFDAQMSALNAEIKTLSEAHGALAKEIAEKDKTPEKAPAELKEKLAELGRQLAPKQQAKGALELVGAYETAYAVVEGKPKNARIHKRGEPLDLGEEVPRRFLDVLGKDPLADMAVSGRLQLAEWLTRPENPLTARVMVNRIWQHHFGTGLVSTTNDFGSRGQKPIDPELLDYLSARFREENWSVKSLHRLILRSRAYQLSSRATPQALAADPANTLLSYFPRRRLDAESIRDSLLAIGGKLNPAMAGPHPFPPVNQWGYTQHAPFAAVYETNHRSVYLMTQRIKRHPYLALFDGADTNASTPKRAPTTVPTQALFFMNDPLVHEQAGGFAGRLLAAGGDEPARIKRAYQTALGRSPTAEEEREVCMFLESYRAKLAELQSPADQREPLAWSALARTLFARNEFAFVE